MDIRRMGHPLLDTLALRGLGNILARSRNILDLTCRVDILPYVLEEHPRKKA